MKNIFGLVWLLWLVMVNASFAATASSITQFGITWTFDHAYEAGQFCTGDWWVVGPVTIININPRSIDSSGRIKNGSMLNPAINLLQGYDSWMLGSADRAWDPTLNAGRPHGADISASNPLTITIGSLVSCISYPDLRAAKNVRVMAVLTVLNAVPATGAFRPPYAGTDKSIRHTLSEVDTSLLLKLPVPPLNPAYVLEMPTHLARFEKPWIEHFADWQKQLFCAPDNMPNYGADYSMYVGDAACLLMLNVDQADKKLLMTRLVQLGLDNYGMLQVPGGRTTWTANGGHMSGRAFPIVFAGHMLGDQTMLGIMQKTGQYAYQNGHYAGNLPSDYVHFGEIDQTFYITQQAVDITHNVGEFTWAPDLRPGTPVPYEARDLGRPEWGFAHAGSPGGDNNRQDAEYRAVNLPAWAGFILVSRMLNLADAWDHPALFDYFDAWTSASGTFIFTNFQKAMWNAYRADYGCAYTGMDTLTHVRQYDCSRCQYNCPTRITDKNKNIPAHSLAGRTIPNPLSPAWLGNLPANTTLHTLDGKPVQIKPNVADGVYLLKQENRVYKAIVVTNPGIIDNNFPIGYRERNRVSPSKPYARLR